MLDWNVEVLGAGGCEKEETGGGPGGPRSATNMYKYENREKVGKWVGSGRGRSRLVQNDQGNCRKVFKRVLAKDSLKKQ